MGKTLKTLSSRHVGEKSIFNNRFVVEICEKVHIHYRNLRILMSLKDWIAFAEGVADSLARWEKRGKPECDPATHIELCRKSLEISSKEDMIKINLNENLYPKYEGKIFSEGADFKDKFYVHFKIRDLRLEMSVPEFMEMASSVSKASEILKEIPYA